MKVIAFPTTYPVAQISNADAIVASLRKVRVQLLDDSLRLSF
jgi:hypothetical protein